MATQDKAKDKKAKAEAPTIDLSTVQIETVSPLPKSRPSKYGDSNPFDGALTASKHENTGRSVTVATEDAAKAVVNALRNSASRLEIGVRVVGPEKTSQGWRVSFQGKDKRKYTPKPKTPAEGAGAAPAEGAGAAPAEGAGETVQTGSEGQQEGAGQPQT